MERTSERHVKSSEHPIFPRRPDRWGVRLLVGLLVALLLHVAMVGSVALFALLGWLNTSSDAKPVVFNEPVALLNLPPSQWSENRSIGPKRPPNPTDQVPAPPKPTEEKKKEPEPLPKGQVVDVAPGNDQKPPEDSKYLAEHNNKVDRQTKSKDQTPFYKNAMPNRTTTLPPTETQGRDNVDKPQVAGNEGKSNDQRPEQQGKTAGHFEVPSVDKRDKVALLDKGKNGDIKNQNESEKVEGNSNRLRVTPGEPGGPSEAEGSLGKLGGRNQLNLMPSQAQLDKITGAAPNDHLDDVDEGQGTFLNTREFKYSTFFNRVKQRVGENWDPGTPLRQRDPEGRIYAYKDRYTMLSVSLDQKGRVLQITVEKSCGVDFLDHEAVAAFERAQPFPNPPPGLVDSSGEVRFTFGFFLEVSSGSSLRIFRSRD